MKFLKRIFYTLMLLPLLVSIISICFLPSIILTHYNIYNDVDRWGSKYEVLIIPIFTIIFGQFLLFMSKISKKQNKDNERSGIIIGIFGLLVFNIISGIMIYSSIAR